MLLAVAGDGVGQIDGVDGGHGRVVAHDHMIIDRHLHRRRIGHVFDRHIGLGLGDGAGLHAIRVLHGHFGQHHGGILAEEPGVEEWRHASVVGRSGGEGQLHLLPVDARRLLHFRFLHDADRLLGRLHIDAVVRRPAGGEGAVAHGHAYGAGHGCRHVQAQRSGVVTRLGELLTEPLDGGLARLLLLTKANQLVFDGHHLRLVIIHAPRKLIERHAALGRGGHLLRHARLEEFEHLLVRLRFDADLPELVFVRSE